MLTKSWKQELKERPLFGCFVTFGSPGLTEFTARMGFDFILIDNEHGSMNQETIENMIRASQCAGVPAIVRVPQNRPEYIQKSLDNGANGIQVPLTSNAEEVTKVVQAAHYPPYGERGVAYQTRAAHFGLYPNRGAYLTDADEEKLVCVHIETREAVEKLDEILNIEGVDVFFVGPGDLSAAMGYAKNPNDPEFISIVEECIRKITCKGKIAGTYVGNVEQAQKYVELGCRYIVTILTPYMAQGAQQFLRSVKRV
ncbi:HpcH/HpaI aldolase/citrate lyase family protein [Ammoniphilus sp. 3BR4]|uniref:HpcH/HpaI aldolase family protein n=1 Tax=Ammoniphilus sp. 3BR4 TaxID=3158265 RepID=UPI003467D82E